MTDAPYAALSIRPGVGRAPLHKAPGRSDRELGAFAERRLAVAT